MTTELEPHREDAAVGDPSTNGHAVGVSTNGSRSHLRERVERPVRRRRWSTRERMLVAALSSVVAWGVFAWIHQVRTGLGVTGLNNRVSWGLYITNFVFFIGISHAGTLVSAILRLTGAEWRRPVTRLAEMITVVALATGASMVVVDMGRPDRLANILRYPHLRSPILWDVLSISTYITGSLIYLFLPLVPDVARLRDATSVGRIRRRVYRALSLRWAGTPEQRRGLQRAIGIMAIVIVPVAVSVHTVVSWIFGMTLRDGWNSTIFGPYFVVGAIFSGIAGIIVVMAIFRRAYHLETYITERHFQNLGSLLLVLGLIYVYFTASEYITVGFKLRVGDDALLSALLVGRYAPLFWAFAIGGTFVPILLLALRRTRTIRWIVTAAVLVNIGMWLKRFVIIVPSMALPLMPWEWGTYRPTWVEWSITAAAFSGFALLFVLLARVFPVVSVWEVEEGWELQTAAHAPTTVDHAFAGNGNGDGGNGTGNGRSPAGAHELELEETP
ncbi:MAG: NrfD/PsrC family molybdoenzyme membrane anchor subunit [Actinomycetota bacterium]